VLTNYLLSFLIWFPIVGGVALLVMGDGDDTKSPQARLMRRAALAFTTLTFVASIGLYLAFDNTEPGMQFVERVPWIGAFNVWYYLGVDGLSAPLILLTTFITPLIVIAGWDSIKNRPAQYYAAFLILEGLMIGVDHRCLGWRTACLRNLEVLSVHVPRLSADARCVYLPVLAGEHVQSPGFHEPAD
jgi:NADH-quinone oxidoreductase subunit M